MNQEMLSLLSQTDPAAPIVWRNGQPVSQRRFLQQATALAARLPQSEYAINLCEDRYHFLLVFVAMMLRRQISLLPANRSVVELQSIAARYDHCPCIADKTQPELDLEQFVVNADTLSGDEPDKVPAIPASQPCAVVFTSGSTGHSVPWPKSWGELYHGALLSQRVLAQDEQVRSVVATVPPQHMYGLETTIVLPLVTGMSLDGGRPFFPHDLQDALASVPAPRLLITTPVHLKACLEAAVEWPEVGQIISATAPLSQALAVRAEAAFGCPLREIYGSTETGAIATRRTCCDTAWTLHQGLTMETAAMQECVSVSGGHLGRAITLNDRIRIEAEGRFILLGRNSDMLKIAGKRVSLGDLNNKLVAIPGVEDGVFVEAPSKEDGPISRLCAFVVAPSLEQKDILDALRVQVDPVCLPRPLHFVERLPRNEAGKLSKQALQTLLEQYRRH